MAIMEDPRGEKLAVISLHETKPARQVLECITNWNQHQPDDAIRLTPHNGDDEIITLLTKDFPMITHPTCRMIKEEEEKARRGEQNTYWGWKAQSPSKILKNLGNNLTEGFIQPAASKRMPKKVRSYTEEQFDVRRKRSSASVDTESEEDLGMGGVAADVVDAPVEQGMPGVDEPMPKINAQPQVGKQTVVMDFEAFVDLNKTALKAKDEAYQSKDDVCTLYKQYFERERTLMAETRKELEKLRAHNEEKNALIQELKDRYAKDNGKPFKPSPKRRGV